jgi:hypothetical protein
MPSWKLLNLLTGRETYKIKIEISSSWPSTQYNYPRNYVPKFKLIIHLFNNFEYRGDFKALVFSFESLHEKSDLIW